MCVCVWQWMGVCVGGGWVGYGGSVCVYVYMCVFAYLCRYICVYIHLLIRIHIQAYMTTYIHVYIYTHIPIHTHISTYLPVFVHNHWLNNITATVVNAQNNDCIAQVGQLSSRKDSSLFVYLFICVCILFFSFA